VEELRVSEHAFAAVRTPPGKGPFPAIIFLHGGLGHSDMNGLRRNALTQPTSSRFLAWGYVTVNATRRANADDPGSRGVILDTLGIVEAVRKLPKVDPSSIVLYGGSGGGTLAFEVAGETDLAAIVAGEPATIIYMGMFTKEHVDFGPDGKPTGDRRSDVMNADPQALYTAALRERTRAKLKKLRCPALVLHGDQHQLKGFNFGVFIPEARAMGKSVQAYLYPGEPHGFYWGQGHDPAVAAKAVQDAEAFIRKHIRTAPQPIEESQLKMVEVTSQRSAGQPDERQ
jgi:dienelactone hydrolase